MSRVARYLGEAEIDALAQLCETLNGFGAELAVETLDGYFTALLAGRRAVLPSEWMPRLLGDAFDRAFADPESAQQATATLMALWNAIASQLDPESLVDDPDTLRLQPLMVAYDDAARAEIVAEGGISAEEAADVLQTGGLWAASFLQAVDDFSDDWPDPEDDDAEGDWYEDALLRIALLAMSQAELAERWAELSPDAPLPPRDELIDEALFSAQDLRVYWLDKAPKPVTRRVEKTPGRNDPCPCGSGKKYKKCHGAAVAG